MVIINKMLTRIKLNHLKTNYTLPCAQYLYMQQQKQC